MASAELSNKLTLETVREMISKDEPDVEVINLDEEPGSGRGDNYTSMLYRLKIHGRKHVKPDKWKKWEKDIIYKVLPDSKEKRDAFKSESLFRNEVVFYTKVWPELKALQVNKPVFDGVVKIYIARNDLIAMEDLRAHGFKMEDRRKGLQVDKLKLVLNSLAGFHALSLTLREQKPQVFSRLANPNYGIKETLFKKENEDWYREYYRNATSNAIKMVNEGLPPSLEARRNEILSKFTAFLNEDVFFPEMCKLTSTQGPLTVFCHGDCWTNNFLFKENDSKTELNDVYIVDFQLARVGSLALDLAYLLYCCTSGVVRKTNMVQLLRYYHNHLIEALKIVNPNSKLLEDPDSFWNLLNEEMRRCARFGLGLAIDMLPISTCKSDQAPDLYEEKDSGEKHPTAAPPIAGAECTKLMTELVVELIDCNVI